MELDDLKKMVDSATSNYEPQNNNQKQLMDSKSQSTLARIAKKNKIGLVLFPVTAVLFSVVFATHSQAFHSLLMWMLLGILFTEFMHLSFSYWLIKKLQNPLGNTKENLFSKINRLKISFKKQALITLYFYALMAIVLEAAMYYKMDSYFSTWYMTPMPLRITTYITFLAIQFIIKRYSYKKQFGEQIEELKNLIKQFQ